MTTASIFSVVSRHAAHRHAATLVVAAGLLVGAVPSHAEDAPAATPPKTERCVQLNRIRQTKVVDNKTLLFYMTQTKIYKNVLPNQCGALQPDQAFLYKSSINQLCSVDTITPLISTGGGYMAATSCGLGSFELIDKAGADKLVKDAKAARTASR